MKTWDVSYPDLTLLVRPAQLGEGLRSPFATVEKSKHGLMRSNVMRLSRAE